ncbi:HNT [Lepeophtheirus salmonis]|uniref:15-hydroxyprostaglandin dehydrogenase [NAD(+)] n=1 Tax=Lepeophtheirus salmonis TaxID=72036 RepID=A0A7R8HBC3_LEPSM|nr:HNT [Lepeophtheirus salmonis]CAF2992043.1 HNT [Lepeophtheirus salmonis]
MCSFFIPRDPFHSFYVYGFPPMIWIPNQLVGAPLGTDVKLECHTESSPKAISYWVFDGVMVLDTPRFRSEEQIHSEYKLDSRLHIKNLQKEDFGPYKCITKKLPGRNRGINHVVRIGNAHGSADAYGNDVINERREGEDEEGLVGEGDLYTSDKGYRPGNEDGRDPSKSNGEARDLSEESNSQNRYFSYESDLFGNGHSGISSNFKNGATTLAKVLDKGSARGLGKGFSRAILENGGYVMLSDVLNQDGHETLLEFQKEFGEEKVAYNFCDVTDSTSFEELWRKTAGWRKCLDVNIRAVMNGNDLAIEKMSKANGGDGGHVINIGSTGGFITGPDQESASYFVSKSGVVTLTRKFWLKKCL